MKFYSFLSFFLIFTLGSFAQETKNLSDWSFQELEQKYEFMDSNNSNKDSAIIYIQAAIKKSKKEKNYNNLRRAYRTAAGFSQSTVKSAYADSMVWAAEKTGVKDHIGLAWLAKGINHYNLRDYKSALTAYEDAVFYLKESDDLYLKYKTEYNYALINAYLGYPEKSKSQYETCLTVFEQGMRTVDSPNIRFNYTRYYLYTLHRLINLNQEFGDLETSENILELALSVSEQKGHEYERSLLKKSLGVQNYLTNNYSESVKVFEEIIPGFIKNDDFDWTAVSYFYLGKNFWELGEKEKAVKYFKNVDSIFLARDYFNPDLRETYQLLMNYYEENNEISAQLKVIDRLIVANQFREKELEDLNLSLQNKMEAETLALIKQKEDLETQNASLNIWMFALGGLFLVVLSYFIVKSRNTKKRLQELLKEEPKESFTRELAKKNVVKPTSGMAGETAKLLLSQLEEFEKKRTFLEPGWTQKKLANELGTNAHYLSEVLNNDLGVSFNTWLNGLRINALIERLKFSNEARTLTTDEISKEYGFNNRQSFGRAFKTRTGVSLTRFLKELDKKPEINIKKKSFENENNPESKELDVKVL